MSDFAVTFQTREDLLAEMVQQAECEGMTPEDIEGFKRVSRRQTDHEFDLTYAMYWGIRPGVYPSTPARVMMPRDYIRRFVA